MKTYTLLIAAMLVAGCGSENPFDRGKDYDLGDQGVPTGPISFSEHVIDALRTCSACHAAGAGGWTYAGGADAYQAVASVVDTANPETSSLLVNGTGGDGHGGGTIFTVGSTEYETILSWIQQGAENN